MMDEHRKALVTQRIFNKIIDLGCNSLICNAICYVEKIRINKYFTDEELIDVIGCANRCIELNTYVNDRWHELTAAEKYEIILNEVTQHISNSNFFADSLAYSD